MKTKCFSAFVSAALLLPGLAIPAAAAEQTAPGRSEEAERPVRILREGTIGTARWTIDSDHVLTIGKGVLTAEDGAAETWPWTADAAMITAVDGSAAFQAIGDFSRAFCGLSHAVTMDFTGWDTSGMQSMESMFAQCSSLSRLDLAGWDTSNVATMVGLFEGCSSLSSIRCDPAAKTILPALPLSSSWYQDGRGPGSIDDLLSFPMEKTVWLTRSLKMYRLYNPNSGEHFYTSADSEKDSLVSIGWISEGIGWKAPEFSKIPVYRLYTPGAGDHHYTLDTNERNTLLRLGWKDEGVGWYSDETETVPLYRQYNPNAKTGSHNYTADRKENDELVRLGWHAEGIGWYGMEE